MARGKTEVEEQPQVSEEVVDTSENVESESEEEEDDEEEEVSAEEVAAQPKIDALRSAIDGFEHDALTGPLCDQIFKGMVEIYEANEKKFAAESGTGVRDLDKALKENFTQEYKTVEVKDDSGNPVKDDEGKTLTKQVPQKDLSDKDQEIVEAVAKMEEARAAFKDAQKAARNLYSVKVLGEEAKEEVEFDEDALKETRKMVQEAVGLLRTFSNSNGKMEFVRWADSLEIPQIGRKGTSVLGQKKPRAYVHVRVPDSEKFEVKQNFGEAAKLIADTENSGKKKEDQITLNAGNLIQHWSDHGELQNTPLDYTTPNGTVYGLKVINKPKKSEQNKK